MVGQMAVGAVTHMPAVGSQPVSLETGSMPGYWNASELSRSMEGIPSHLLSFEARARQVATPDALGQQFASLLKRFQEHSSRVERSNESHGAGGSAVAAGGGDTPAAPTTIVADGRVNPAATNPDAGRESMDRSIDMMLDMFEFAIETQLVAKGSTQFSGTINTLLKGQ